MVERELARHADAASHDIAIVDASGVIGMAEMPTQALRRTPRASLRLAAEAVADGRAVALFSAWNTRATVMAAYGRFGLLPGVGPPALATTIPAVSATDDRRPRRVRNAVALAHRFAAQHVVGKLETGIAAVTVPQP